MFKKPALATVFVLLGTMPALAWGTAGHRLINQTAAQSLPDTLPAFVRTTDATYELQQLGPELDRLKDSGDPHDYDDDPGHYLNVNDDLRIAGVVSLKALPKSRELYDTALRAAKSDQYDLGFLPYNIIDGWQQVRKDFAYWRADDYLAQHAATADDQAWFAKDRALRETLTLRDIGVWGHYVGDGSQPLHVTVHYNGWGKYPNPKGYSDSHRTHSNFEGTYVRLYANPEQVKSFVVGMNAVPYANGAPAIQQMEAVKLQIENYLAGSAAAVIPLYELDKRGAFAAQTPEGTDFVDHQLARGAQELRDLVVDAWDSSASADVAYPLIPVQDILSGKVVPTAKQFGSD